ncbi:MAG TPA: DUF4097 family beta strand repeat-containing protein [Candidatus Limnocylindrales bacterium]|nr:DUF4097 family beta strand repeat-containing protein [Candidatus Limnocylindrales bacterium]
MSSTGTARTIEHRIGETGSLTVRVAQLDVEVVAVSGDVVRVKGADRADVPDNIEIDRDAESLTIRQQQRFGLDIAIGRRSSTSKLAIEVPARAAVTVQTASGDVQAANLRGPVRMRTTSGDILLVDVAGDVQVETVSGDVAIRLAGPTGLGAKSVSGDTIVEGGRVDHFAFQSTSGDLRLHSELGDGPHAIATVSGDATVTTRNGIRVAAQTVTGDLMSDLPHSSEGRAGRRSLVVGEGSKVVQFRSVSGDLRVVGPNGGGPVLAPNRPNAPEPPTPPTSPTPPAAPVPVATASATGAGTDSGAADGSDDAGDAEAADPAAEVARLDILRALERGEIDIDEATSRLASLDGPTDA